jgi:hypothetical protein
MFKRHTVPVEQPLHPRADPPGNIRQDEDTALASYAGTYLPVS